MPISEAKKKSNKKWNDENLKTRYDHIHIVFPKGWKDKVSMHASEQGLTLGAYIKQLISRDMGDIEL